MTNGSISNLKRELTLSERTLTEKVFDFQAKFMAVYSLQAMTQSHPEVINTNTIEVLEKVLLDSDFTHQTQAYFMYKEVANTLCSIIIHSKVMADNALTTLKSLLASTKGHPHRAAAEALGALPFSIHGPNIKTRTHMDIPTITWDQFLKEVGYSFSDVFQFIGRSLVSRMSGNEKMLVIKWARDDESAENLLMETLWMEYLGKNSPCFDVRFDIPSPLKIKGSFVFRLQGQPIAVPAAFRLHKNRYAVSFVADGDYFTYANDTRKDKQLSKEAFGDLIFGNARLLGKLTSLGIVHAAPVPLFHNRVQRGRRRDHGLYEWPRAGRLDRWLESCLYPNLGLTGIRDFEHLISVSGKSKRLYRHIGVHLMSLLLILGSYFRNKDRTRVGFDSNGRPVDARDLFDKAFLKTGIFRIFRGYYTGFTSCEFEGDLPVDLDMLATRMIDEMGVDRHMEEILRVGDQRQMTEKDFRYFLRRRGFSGQKIRSLQKGAEDITIYSGPHLGEFNHQISIPELIEAVGTMSSLVIAGRYCS